MFDFGGIKIVEEFSDMNDWIGSEGCNKNVVDWDFGNIWFIGFLDKNVVIGFW